MCSSFGSTKLGMELNWRMNGTDSSSLHPMDAISILNPRIGANLGDQITEHERYSVFKRRFALDTE